MDDEITILELREYRILEGRREAFAEHVRTVRMPIYERIGWRCDGFWVPDDDPSRVHYILHWTSLEERAEKRAVLAVDPEWIAYKESEPEQLVDGFVFTLMSRLNR